MHFYPTKIQKILISIVILAALAIIFLLFRSAVQIKQQASKRMPPPADLVKIEHPKPAPADLPQNKPNIKPTPADLAKPEKPVPSPADLEAIKEASSTKKLSPADMIKVEHKAPSPADLNK